VRAVSQPLQKAVKRSGDTYFDFSPNRVLNPGYCYFLGLTPRWNLALAHFVDRLPHIVKEPLPPDLGSFALEQDLFSFLLEHTPDQIYFKDRRGRFLRVSHAVAQYMHVSGPEDLIGKSDFDFWSQETARECFADEQRIMQTGEPMVGKIEKLVFPDGRVTWDYTTKLPLKNSKGEIIGICGINKDFTAFGDLTASIAHEINQPLAAMVINASACVRWLTAQNLEEARRAASLVIAEGQRAGEIIARIRALAKKAPPQKDWLDLNETIGEVIAKVGSEARRNRISLQTQLANDLPPIRR